jgi:HAD superfamily hydrolase (TIGR01509 family)
MYTYWIFDMDGTLTDSMGIWDQVPFQLLSMYHKTPKPDLREILLPLGMAETARYMTHEYNLPLDEAGFEAQTQEAIRQLYQTVELRKGVLQLLTQLKAAGAHLCVCSNTWQPMCEEVLGRLGILDYFDFILSAQDGFTKKEPAIFLEAMRRLGASDPADCVVCEDAVHAIRTASSAGFHILGIADRYSSADEAEIRRLSDRFITEWVEFDPANAGF